MILTKVGCTQNFFLLAIVMVLSMPWNKANNAQAQTTNDRSMKPHKMDDMDTPKSSSTSSLLGNTVVSNDDDPITMTRRRRKRFMPPLRKMVAATVLVLLPMAIVPAIWSLIVALASIRDVTF